MRNDMERTEAGRLYRAAYTAHYTGRDLPGALRLYMQVVASHPNGQEAGYSRSQVENIVKAVVPKQEILDAHLKLAFAHFERPGASETAQVAVTLLPSGPSP